MKIELLAKCYKGLEFHVFFFFLKFFAYNLIFRKLSLKPGHMAKKFQNRGILLLVLNEKDAHFGHKYSYTTLCKFVS